MLKQAVGCVAMGAWLVGWAVFRPSYAQNAATRESDAALVARLEALDHRGEVLLPNYERLFDPARRKALVPQLLPLLRDSLHLIDQLGASADPKSREIAAQCNRILPVLAGLADGDARARIRAQLQSPDKSEVVQGQANELVADWIASAGDSAGRKKLVERAGALLKAHPASDTLASAVWDIGNELNPDGRAVRDPILVMVAATQTRVAPQARHAIESLEHQSPLQEKAMVLEGTTVEGKHFSTSDWKGKVVLVDFWATWCGPCRAELPRLEKLYAQYHPKGLEVLGVSSDRDADTLRRFLGANPAMPWPQLFDPQSEGWHPLAKKLDIDSIPTLFLIDRKGVLRSTEAARDLEELLPKLIAEQP